METSSHIANCRPTPTREYCKHPVSLRGPPLRRVFGGRESRIPDDRSSPYLCNFVVRSEAGDFGRWGTAAAFILVYAETQDKVAPDSEAPYPNAGDGASRWWRAVIQRQDGRWAQLRGERASREESFVKLPGLLALYIAMLSPAGSWSCRPHRYLPSLPCRPSHCPS